MIDRVDEPGVHLDLPAPDDLHRSSLADARLVVTVDVGAHGELALLLLIAQDLLDVLRVLERVTPPPDGAGDRAGLAPGRGDN